MKRIVIGIVGIVLLGGIEPAYSQQSNVDLAPVLDQARQVLPESDYLEFEDSIQNLYFDEAEEVEGAAAKTAGILDYIPFVIAAYLFDWVDPHIYVWNSADGQYEIWPSCNMIELPPWSGFWVRANRDVELKIRPWIWDDAPDVGDTMQLALENDTYYFISPPLKPSSTGILDNFGDDLGTDTFEQTARIAKWNHVTAEYDRFIPGSPFPELLSGRGYWAYQIQGGTKTLDITGTKFSTNLLDLHTCTRSLPEGDHMCGNPFHYDMNLVMLFVKPVDSSGSEIAKVAVSGDESLLGSLESWHVDIGLATPDGDYLDTFNRAGVIESGADIHEKLSAVDMPAMGDNIRLAILNSESGTGRYAFDIRSPGADEYVWDLELSTSLDQAVAALSLENIGAVPESYTLTLVDEHGVETEIGSDMTFPVELTGGAAQTWHLKATRSNPVGVETANVPETVNITGIAPNPFNPATTISFELDRTGEVAVKVFSVNGQLVETLADDVMEAGSHRITWNASGQSSGIYLVSVSSNGHTVYRKMTLLK